MKTNKINTAIIDKLEDDFKNFTMILGYRNFFTKQDKLLLSSTLNDTLFLIIISEHRITNILRIELNNIIEYKS